MRSHTTNWILSIIIALILISYYYLNINEVENYRDKIISHYNNLIMNSINNQFEHSFYSSKNIQNKNQIDLDSNTRQLIKDALYGYLDNPKIVFIILQSQKEKIFLTNNQNIIPQIPHISNEDLFLLYQNSVCQTYEFTYNDREISEIRFPSQIKFSEPVIIRMGVDSWELTPHYQNHLLNSAVITFFLLLIILLFINYKDIFDKQTKILSDNQMVISIFSKISDNSNNGIIFIDPQQRIRIFNNVAATITGIDKQVALMNDYFQVFPNDYFNVDEVFSNQKSIGLTNITIITDKGIKRDLYFSTTLLIIDEVFSGVLISIQDVTEFNKNLNLKINQKIIEANSTLGVGIASSFLNRINRLYLSLQSLLNKKALSEDVIKKTSDFFLSEVLEIESLLNQFEDFIKIEKVRYSQVGINDIFEKVIDSFKSLLKSKNIQIHKNYRMFLTFFCDEKLFTEIVKNIFQNAIESIEDNGEIIISAEQNINSTMIKITDTGCGIDEITQSKFYHPYNTTKQNHLGFGLAKANKNIILLSGELTYVTNKGIGTTFTITLPNRYELKGKV